MPGNVEKNERSDQISLVVMISYFSFIGADLIDRCKLGQQTSVESSLCVNLQLTDVIVQ